MKKEIPILFSTPMVQAILDGRKTMTRRIIKMDDLLENPDRFKSAGDSREWDVPRPAIKYDDRIWFAWELRNSNALTWIERCRYKPGDILWVRECTANLNVDFPSVEPYWVYKADIQIKDQYGPVTWKPSIHMPKDACRIWLEVTNVRVERLREINPNDACDEGVEYWNIDGDALEGGELQADFKNYTWTEKKEDDPNYEDRYFPTFANPVDSFRTLWQSINGPESWAANPWVWVISFNRITKM